MALPKQIKKQVEDNTRLVEEMNKAQQGDTEQPLEADPPPDPGSEPELKSEPSDNPPPDKDEEDQDLPKKSVDEWEQRYRSLQGKYNAEIPRLQDENRRLHKELNDLSDVVKTLKATVRPSESPSAPTTQNSSVSEKDIEEFGEDLHDFIRRVVKDALGNQVTQLSRHYEGLDNRIKGVENRVGTVTEQVQVSARDRFLAQLDQKAENWREVNQDQGFIDWLEQEDPYSGSSRKDLFDAAARNFDADRVARFFNGYTKEKAVVTPPRRAPERAARERVDLERFAAPGRGRASDTPTAEVQGKIWTEPEITQFYEAKRRGAYRNNPQKAAEIEADIVAATAAGRIR